MSYEKSVVLYMCAGKIHFIKLRGKLLCTHSRWTQLKARKPGKKEPRIRTVKSGKRKEETGNKNYEAGTWKQEVGNGKQESRIKKD